MASWGTATLNRLLSSLFQPPCAGCKRTLHAPLDGAVCDECWTALRSCRPLQHRDPAALISWWCAVDHYEGRMKEVIHALKYERRRSISPRLGNLMRECGEELLRGSDAVVPVPLHRRREYDRGFNQAEDLAQYLGVPVVRMLSRVTNTRSQIDLPKHQRHQNVKNAFAITKASGSMIVVLVDDVATTGATLESCAKILLKAGVKEVRAITAARVVNELRQ